MASADVRLQKFLSAAGVTSRRQAEALIVAGRVTVNGSPATELGTKVDPKRDRVDVDGVQIRLRPSVYLLMNKPRGTVCTERDPEGRPRVHDLLPKGLPRLFTVGRLDWDTEGLLLFTNDGDLAKALTDPRRAVPRVYQVKIQGDADPNIIRRFTEGVRLDTGFRTASAPTELIKRTDTNAWYEVVLSEGKNRQIRKMVEACGRRVLKLRRVSYGPVRLGTLPVEKCRPLSEEEIYGLYAAAGLQPIRPQGEGLGAVDVLFDAPAQKPAARGPKTRPSDAAAPARRAPARGKDLDAPPASRRAPARGKDLDAATKPRRAPARAKSYDAPPAARGNSSRPQDGDGARTRTGARARYTEAKVTPGRRKGSEASPKGKPDGGRGRPAGRRR